MTCGGVGQSGGGWMGAAVARLRDSGSAAAAAASASSLCWLLCCDFAIHGNCRCAAM